MNVEFNFLNNDKVPPVNIGYGKVFAFEGDFYMRFRHNESGIYGVNLITGEVGLFHSSDKVKLINATVIVNHKA